MIKSSQRGFTLIELVVVIVILGILAAFAVPRFANLDRQARIASVRALEGSVRSGAALAHSVWLAQGGGAVNMEGQGIAMANGYPTRGGITNTLQAGTIGGAGNGRFTAFNGIAATTVEYRLTGAAAAANCSVRYVQAAAANTAPVITVDVTNC